MVQWVEKALIMRLSTVAVMAASLTFSVVAEAQKHTCKDLSCSENETCVMVEQGAMCVCDFGFKRDRDRKHCVPRQSEVANPLPSQEPGDICSPENVTAVEEALETGQLEKDCLALHKRFKKKNLSYAQMLYRKYRTTRDAGYGVTFLLTPLFAGGATAFWVLTYRHKLQIAKEEPVSVGTDLSHMFFRWAAVVCTAGAAAFLVTGIFCILRGRKRLKQLEPLVAGNHRKSNNGPKLALTPYTTPSGGGGTAFLLEF